MPNRKQVETRNDPSGVFVSCWSLVPADRAVRGAIIRGDQTVVSPAEHLSEPDCRARQEVAIDFDCRLIDGTEYYVWAAVDCETLEVLAVEASPGGLSFDALLFLNDVLEQDRGRPAPAGDRGPWYDWPLELLECEYERET